MRPRPFRYAGLALLLSLGAPVGPALAAPPSSAPVARAAVEKEIADLEGSTAHSAPLAEPLGRARKALARAQAMERAGDVSHAVRAVAAARAWVSVARDVVRVVHAEGSAVLAERKQEEALLRLTRSRALLEESVARRGRAAAVLAELEAKPEVPTTTAPTPATKPAEGTPKRPAGAVRPAQDTKPPAQDTKPPAQDRPPPPQDTGKPPQDTGKPPQDTGKPPQDTNPAPRDTKKPTRDTPEAPAKPGATP